MSNYAIFFDKDNVTYRLPVNPEEIKMSNAQAIEKYEVLKLGQIAVPTHVELKEYGFECEFPHAPEHYVETSGSFRDADYYLNLFRKWREEKVPVRFIASNGVSEDINTLVLIEKLTITERSGEEGDKYVSFDLIEYREFSKKVAIVPTTKTIDKTTETVVIPKREEPAPTVNPKSTGSYVVKAGDTLWAIAKIHYGNGAQYPKIVEANKIKNPSLIYPGQKLVIPA